jgi:peroxiredoxin (alkyl hydroperoxide reductase subunit C)
VAIAAGEPAPEFSLARSEGAAFTREDLLGRTTVLVFYPFAFSPVCTDQLSDFEPKGAVCRAFDVLHPKGFPHRALVVIGPDGVVKWSYQAPKPSELPGANLIFDNL